MGINQNTNDYRGGKKPSFLGTGSQSPGKRKRRGETKTHSGKKEGVTETP